MDIRPVAQVDERERPKLEDARSNRVGASMFFGAVAKRKGCGLQTRDRRFDSGPRLHFADIAQLVEHLFRNQDVAGSTPAVGSNTESAA